MNIKLEKNNLDRLNETIVASIRVFKPTPEEKKIYHDKQDWLKKIKNGNLLITADVNNQIVGFSFCYINENNLHVWNVGVLEEYRKHGIWKLMFQEILNYAIEREFKNITLNTYKSRFPGMYSFCENNGFKEYKTENKKSFFIKEI